MVHTHTFNKSSAPAHSVFTIESLLENALDSAANAAKYLAMIWVVSCCKRAFEDRDEFYKYSENNFSTCFTRGDIKTHGANSRVCSTGDDVKKVILRYLLENGMK